MASELTTQQVENMLRQLLASELHPTPDRIREGIARLRLIAPMADAAAEALARRFEELYGVIMAVGVVLEEEGHAQWLPAAKERIDPYYWDRYELYLGDQGFSPNVVATLDQDTERLLGLLENPEREGPWDRRGMVVGHVQSGKTANYTGLICKAADAGYRLIIVVAGVHNNLRNQTQMRIDEGFVGRRSAAVLAKTTPAQSVIGVGRFEQRRKPFTFTNSVRDFDKASATGVGVSLRNLNEPAVFVIKKNASTLGNLLDWLKSHSATGASETIDTPMLLIDDEADNASINIRHDQQKVARINGQIRSLLNLFDRSCYVGYTATPFANIFIDPDTDDEMFRADLFPRHFVVSLESPTNYFGPRDVFVDGGERVIRHVGDNADRLPLRHGIDFEIGALPESLIEAVRTFVLACGIRRARGQGTKHSSMLVNASRFKGVQGQLRGALHQLLSDIQRSLRINGGKGVDGADRDPVIRALRKTWESQYGALPEEWPTVLSCLDQASRPIRVIEVNSSKSSGKLDYSEHGEEGLSVIAVGGFSLSRGLTLEGLVVSYFLRNSMMYDTLMQMARWFGYRPGYQDLCRVWMPEEAEGWYSHIAESTEMLRDDIRLMEKSGATPEDFGLRVRSHPDSLMVVARNKLGSGERVVVRVGLSNQFVETATLLRKAVHGNREAAAILAKDLVRLGVGADRAQAVVAPGGWLIRDVPVAAVHAFVQAFENDPRSMLTDSKPILEYIDTRRADELALWDVFLPSLSQEKDGDLVDDTTFGIPIRCQNRTAGAKSDSRSIRVTNRQRVASRGVEKAGLTDVQCASAEDGYRGTLGSSLRETAVNYPDRIYRAQRTVPLLIVQLLQIHEAAPGGAGAEKPRLPTVAWGISFPRSARPEKRVEYVVNATYLKENGLLTDDADVDEEMDDLDA